ncbi:MAG: hypothetical protein AAGA66_04660 [Bacteroidota bacterium]
MDKKKIFTLSLKFKRHNVQFDYDEPSQKITIGKTLKVKRKILEGVALIAISIPALIILLPMNFIARKILLILFFAPIGYGLSQIYKYVKLANKNKSKKVIGTDSIQIESSDGLEIFGKDQIAKIDIELKRDKDLEGEGSIFILNKSGEKKTLLHLRDKKLSDLKLDLEYLKDFIKESMGIAVAEE